MIRADRRDDRKVTGGGCLIAVDKKYEVQIVELPTEFLAAQVDIDILAVKIWIKSFSINIVVLYVPPGYNNNLTLYGNVLGSLADFLSGLAGGTMLLGDLNIPQYYNHVMNGTVDRLAEIIINYTALLGLDQYNLVLNNKGRLLDLIFGSVYCDVTRKLEALVEPGGYHPPLNISVDFYLVKMGRNGCNLR